MALNNKLYHDGNISLTKKTLNDYEMGSFNYVNDVNFMDQILNALWLFDISFRAGAQQDKSKGVGYNIGERDEYGSRV